MPSRRLRLISAACFAVAAVLFALVGTWWAAVVCGIIAIVMLVLARSSPPR